MTQYLPDVALAAILAILLFAMIRWVSLWRLARDEPWNAVQHAAGRRHVEILGVLCLATLAVGLMIAEIEGDETRQEILVDVSSASERVSYEVVSFPAGEFDTGEACDDREAADHEPEVAKCDGDNQELYRGKKKEIWDEIEARFPADREPGPDSWAFAVGGHDRQRYLGGLHESNADLAFARARCVTEVLSCWLRTNHRESAADVKIFSMPGGARSVVTAEKDNREDRVVDVFLYLKKREVEKDAEKAAG